MTHDAKLESFLLRPLDSWAYLDWITGIIRVNCGPEQYNKLQTKLRAGEIDNSRVSHDDVQLLETVTHETTHYMQICTTGYMYSLATSLFDVFHKHVLKHNITKLEDLSEISLPEVGKQIELVTAKLDKVGPEGITIRSIIEGNAFFVQKRTHWSNFGIDDYRRTLAGQYPEYRVAFDFSCEYLGEEAFLLFPLLTSLALWTNTPAECFLQLCKEYSQNKERIASGELDFLQLLLRVTSDVLYPPIMFEDTLSNKRREIPVYEITIRRLCGLYFLRKFDIFKYLAKPYSIDTNLANEVVPPILLNPIEGEIHLVFPQHFLPETSNNIEIKTRRRDEFAKHLMRLMEISARLHG